MKFLDFFFKYICRKIYLKKNLINVKTVHHFFFFIFFRCNQLKIIYNPKISKFSSNSC